MNADQTTTCVTVTKTWVVPASTEGCKITDGGRFTAQNGDKAMFGANAQAPNKGQQEYQDHGPAEDINMHSTSITAVVCSADKKSGSIFGTATINGAGTYYFRIEPDMEAKPGATDRALGTKYHIVARRGGVGLDLFWIALVLHLIPPIWYSIQKGNFETRRWLESDYAPDSSSSDSSSGDDD